MLKLRVDSWSEFSHQSNLFIKQRNKMNYKLFSIYKLYLNKLFETVGLDKIKTYIQLIKLDF